MTSLYTPWKVRCVGSRYLSTRAVPISSYHRPSLPTPGLVYTLRGTQFTLGFNKSTVYYQSEYQGNRHLLSPSESHGFYGSVDAAPGYLSGYQTIYLIIVLGGGQPCGRSGILTGDCLAWFSMKTDDPSLDTLT